MEWFEALILGIIQGLTEYLPVSSSGHLAIGSALFGIEGEENLAFTVVVHVATVFSTLVVLWKEIEWIFKGLFKWQMNEETRYVINILISMVPIGIVGVFFKDEVETVFGSGLLIVGCMLLVTAALLSFSYYYKPPCLLPESSVAKAEREYFYERCIHYRFGSGLCCTSRTFTFRNYNCYRVIAGR